MRGGVFRAAVDENFGDRGSPDSNARSFKRQKRFVAFGAVSAPLQIRP